MYGLPKLYFFSFLFLYFACENCVLSLKVALFSTRCSTISYKTTDSYSKPCFEIRHGTYLTVFKDHSELMQDIHVMFM